MNYSKTKKIKSHFILFLFFEDSGPYWFFVNFGGSHPERNKIRRRSSLNPARPYICGRSADAKAYKKYLKNLRDIASDQHTKIADAQELIKKGEENKETEAVIGFYEIGVSPESISKALKITLEKVLQIIDSHKNK